MTDFGTLLPSDGMREAHNVGRGDHVCLAYVNSQQCHQAVAGFVTGGLRLGEQVLVVTNGEARDAVLGLLQADGVATHDLLASERLLLLPTELAYGRAERFAPADVHKALAVQTAAARTRGFAGLRAAGAPPAEVPHEVLLDYEAGLEELRASCGTTLLCMYCKTKTKPSVLHALLKLHPQVMLQERLFNNAFFTPASLRAEREPREGKKLDWSINQILRSRDELAVPNAAAADADGGRRTHAQVGRGIEYRDRLIVMLARQLREAVVHLQAPQTAPHEAREAIERLVNLSERLEALAAFVAEPIAPVWRTLDLALAVTDHVQRLSGELPPGCGPVLVQADEPVLGRFDEPETLRAIDSLLRLALRHGCDRRVDVAVERHGPCARVSIAYQGVDGAAAAATIAGKEGHAQDAVDLYDWIGIDLFFARELVRRLGGTLSVASWPDDTVLYTIELSRNSASSPPAAPGS